MAREWMTILTIGEKNSAVDMFAGQLRGKLLYDGENEKKILEKKKKKKRKGKKQ